MTGKTFPEQEAASESAGTTHVDNCIAVDVLMATTSRIRCLRFGMI